MDECQKFGIAFSSEALSSSNDGCATLCALSESESLQKIIAALGSKEVYLVGGTVRDALLGIKGTDIDLASSLSIDTVSKKLADANLKVVPTGLKHGTVTCVINDQNIEITTFRAGRSKVAGTIEEDLSGRDFTINAIAFSCNEKVLIDPFFGATDLKNKLLRFVPEASARLREDPLRALRFVRFGAASGRKTIADDEQAVVTAREALQSVSVERIRNEIEKILLQSNPADGIRALLKLSLLEYTLPELIPTVGFEQNEFHSADVFEHTLHVISETPPDRILRLSALYHDIGKAHTLSIDERGRRHFYDHEKVSAEICKGSMERLRFSNEEIKAVTTLVRLHMRPFDCGPSGVRRILRDTGEFYERWREFKNADRPAVFDDELLRQHKARFDHMVETEKNRQTGSVFGKLALSGDDLITVLGMRPGKELGEILNSLKEAVLEDPELNNRELLLERARTLLQNR